ncbi:hypothetical protein COU19_01130 [Candidatus Kaiserbacteria bacterium CG10_big_fil_rev_8_21_14_0_10_56_12]|uniref:Ribosome-binding factor A n=1 Tax=Candidatus Kaiserbacteria bacterium CG10_big_fil_rev_8_21_14_0_10_56_12 TaxID=1974611 RepID=A0A2H0UA88_9BACT|nr:MAG: hypothetical protein COU19_01130 [Candidatus Kaiserbacteria bacterium CG10_big_fil_rev_8_21_14_0_10_56_12]
MIRDVPQRADHHKERIAEVIAHEAANFIGREAGNDSLITVLRAQLMNRGERAVVFVSVLPDSETRKALAFLERQREAFSDHLKKHAKLGPLPRIEFMPDNGEGELLNNGGQGGN